MGRIALLAAIALALAACGGGGSSEPAPEPVAAADPPPPAPPATFLDACEEYLENHVKGSHNAELKEQRFRRLISIATDVWGNNPELRDLTYHHGKDVLTYLEKETLQSAATRKRYLNDYRAMLNAGRPSLWIPGMVQGETHPRHHSHWKMGIVRIDGHPKACLRLYRPPSPGLNDLHVPTIITEQIPLYDSLRLLEASKYLEGFHAKIRDHHSSMGDVGIPPVGCLN